MKFIKRLLCKNHEYETVTNIGGDMINQLSTFKHTVRSIKRCKHCGKTIRSTELDPDCDVVNFTMRICSDCNK